MDAATSEGPLLCPSLLSHQHPARQPPTSDSSHRGQGHRESTAYHPLHLSLHILLEWRPRQPPEGIQGPSLLGWGGMMSAARQPLQAEGL